MQRSRALRDRLGWFLVLALQVLASSPPISVSIQATWQEPPMLVQVLESAALERPRLFFSSIDAVCSSWETSKSKLSTEQQTYEHLISLLRSPGLLDGPGEIESLAFSIALKEAHPKIEAFRAWYASLPSNLTGAPESEDNASSETEDCKSWALINNSKVCDISKLSELLHPNYHLSEKIQSPPQVLPFDHKQGRSSQKSSVPTVILYASPDPSSFCPFHQVLHKASKKPQPDTTYILRWKINSTPSASSKPSLLSGWGASLDIKKSEYLTLDDRPVESSSSEDAQLILDGAKNPAGIEMQVDFEQAKLTPLKAAEIFDIGAKAAQHILLSPSPLSALRNLAENFPLIAHTLVNEWVPGRISRELRLELQENMAASGIPPGQSVVWMNGLQLSSLVSLENLNFFKLVEIMRSERHWISSLTPLGISSLQARKLIVDEKLNSAMNPEASSASEIGEIDASSLGARFDASDRQEGGGAIIWFNDLENDERYSMWPTNLRAILRPTFPGQLHAIGRNLLNVVLGLDLTQGQNLHNLGHVIEVFISRNLPIRWGVVPIPTTQNTSEGEKMARCFWDMIQALGPMETLKFIKEFTQDLDPQAGAIDVAKFVAEARELVSSSSEQESPEEAQSHEQKFESWLKKSQLYSSRLSLCSNDGSVPACMLINGRFFPMDENYRSQLQETASLHIGFIQHQVYFNLLKDDVNVAEYLYDLPVVHRARNDFVFPSEARPLQFVNLVEALHATNVFAANTFFQNSSPPAKDDEPRPIASLWVIGDLDSNAGLASVAAALGLLIKSSPEASVQVSFVHIPSDNNETKKVISTTLADFLSASHNKKIQLSDLLDQLSGHGHHVMASDEGNQPISDKTTKLILKKVQTERVDVPGTNDLPWLGTEEFARTLGVKSDGVAIIINGRLLHVSPSTKLLSEDLVMLVEYEAQQRINPMMEALKNLDGFDLAKHYLDVPLIMATVGFVLVGSSDDSSSQTFSSEARSSKHLSRDGNYSSYQHGDQSKALFEFSVILNPASEAAQRWSALLETLSHRSDVAIKIWFNPSLEVSELPIKRFFRSAIWNSLEFDQNGRATPALVNFRGIPTETLFTLAIDTPPAWLALPHDSIHDLDNIMLSELPAIYSSQGVEAIFQLDHIILAGHAREVPSDIPPRGLQVVLSDLLRNQEVDTIIMANLGYFQFKSAPGVHRLSIRPGRSLELYQFEKTDSTDGNEEPYQLLSLTTFNGLTIYPRFRKRPDKSDESLIQPLSTSSPKGPVGEFSKMMGHVKHLAAGMLGHHGLDLANGTARSVINVFTVASGLLYERMAYLMCVSVMRHTRSPVKFWFISNFLSPSFKRFIPHLAREYGFDYQLVTYRWPSWLRAQKEKQRVIWGYKILFLDVLFPLEVDRVIFVDSDQIVRTDLKALAELDLGGAPYAYAPMCNDRNETKGFRFWDTGYWKESLQGRPYHISALYVVDLRVFRTVAAGDQLRQHYQALSADPGSLANLDQDLPNNMQGILPIFTLDQSWLWCETWCSDEGLKTAKTIDLCNNPLTHEPKLKRARRLIPEWDVYDQEVAALAARIKDNHKGDLSSKITVQAGEKIEDEDPENNKPAKHDGGDGELESSVLEEERKASTAHDEVGARDEL